MRTCVILAIVASLLAASCSHPEPVGGRPILLFNGVGTSVNDVKAIETLLKNNKLTYATVDSCQLNDMTESELLKSRLLIIPGGNFVEIGNGLSSETLAKIRSAVERGLNYLGICAGAFLAGHIDDRSLNLTSGVKFEFYADVNRDVHKNVVAIATAQGEEMDQYWEDGPQLNGWGKVVSKYPDGSAATVQGNLGKGCVILCGFHPEAPENWRSSMEFTTPVSASTAYASKIIEAALIQHELPHY